MHILYVYIAFFGFLLAAGLSAPCQLFAVSDPSCSSLTNWYANPTRFPAWAPNAQRLWEIDDLQRAIQNMGSVEGAARLFDKLNSGKSIIAVAFGSSFVFDAAGCWQSSVDDLRSLSIIPSPILYPLKEVYDLKRHDPDWLEGRCAAGGFMEVLMEWINASYPNPKHQFINNGRGGGTLSMLAEASCISTHTPQHIDLILLDTVTNVGSVAGAEKLLRGLLKGPGGPLTILASNTKHCGPPSYKNETLHIQCNACLRQGGGRDTAACQGLEEPGYTSEDVATHQGVIAPYQALAKHYNIPHLNILSTMARIMTGNARLENNLTKMELLGQIYSDAAHLRRKNGGLGSLLVADILHLYFVLAKKVWDEKKGAVSLVPAPLPPPLHKEARGHYQTRCYGLSAESLRGARDEKGEVVRVNQLSSDAWSDIFGRQGADDPGSQNLFQQLPRLKIRSSEGWDLQVFYQGKRGRQLKPGWVTNVSGSKLEFEISTNMSPEASSGVDVLILHTKSYDGWGRALVECIQGCDCEAHEIDAHQEATSSLLRLHRVGPVSQHEQCVMRVTSLPASELSIKKSGNLLLSKFKLATITVRSELKEDFK